MKTKLTLILIGICFALNAQQVPRVTPSGIGYLEYLPKDYKTTTKTYPLLIFLHGSGEVGNGTTDINKVKSNGPPRLIQAGHDMCFNGECFIVISPQLAPHKGGWWPDVQKALYEHILANYRIDKNRIYLTGLSLGGQGVYIGLAETPDIFAAGVVVCGFGNSQSSNIAKRNIPVWALHGDKDGTIKYGDGWTEFMRTQWYAKDFLKKEIAEQKWTQYVGVGHNAWDKAYTTDHSAQDPNIYEWLLSKTKGIPTPTEPPIVEPPKPTTTGIFINGTKYVVPNDCTGQAIGTVYNSSGTLKICP